MDRGQYIAGTGMLLQRRQMEIITNNITNADTVGFKKDHLVSHSFDDVLIRRINDTSVVGMTNYAPVGTVGPLNFGTQVDQVYTNFEHGNFEETGLNTDFALVGDAFFAIQTPAGERYTKAGAFYLDNAGYLVDGNGNYLLSNTGAIHVGSDNFAVDELGNVSVDGRTIATLRIVSFPDNNMLRKQGDNLYFALNTQPQQARNFAVKQGFLENSNVEIGREMVDMLTVYRAYETNQRMLTMIDETVGKAVNEIGRVR